MTPPRVKICCLSSGDEMEIVASSPAPVFLAGGLRSDTACEAIRTVRPFGLDLCTGVRPDGHLDAEMPRRFMDAAGAGRL